MALCYKKLWKLLIDHDMTRADLRGATGIAPATIAKMSRGESVGASVLERICESLQCNIGDIVDYVPNESESGQIAEAKRARNCAPSAKRRGGWRARYWATAGGFPDEAR